MTDPDAAPNGVHPGFDTKAGAVVCGELGLRSHLFPRFVFPSG
jgi:hypothetical protein